MKIRSKRASVLRPDFFAWPPLADTITDTHFVVRDRFGRTVVFIARIIHDALLAQRRKRLRAWASIKPAPWRSDRTAWERSSTLPAEREPISFTARRPIRSPATVRSTIRFRFHTSLATANVSTFFTRRRTTAWYPITVDGAHVPVLQQRPVQMTAAPARRSAVRRRRSRRLGRVRSQRRGLRRRPGSERRSSRSARSTFRYCCVPRRNRLSPRRPCAKAWSNASASSRMKSPSWPRRITANRFMPTPFVRFSAKIGEPEQALLCGPHPPYDERAATALRQSGEAFSAVHNNCSGKHAGILALTALLGASEANYLDPGHAAQRLILALCARLSDARVEDLPLGNRRLRHPRLCGSAAQRRTLVRALGERSKASTNATRARCESCATR